MATAQNLTSYGKLFLTFLYLLVFPAILLAISGDWCWLEGWIFGIWFLLMCSSVILYLYKNDPELLNERYKKPGEGNQKPWDKFVVVGLFVGFTGWIIIMPLDASRHHWSGATPIAIKAIGLAGLLVSWYLFFRTYKDNTFLSPLVRIQTERKQQLVTTGVYGFVRHPMYLAAMIMFFSGPLLLGSHYALLLGLLIMILLAFRIIGEEKMLQEEFEGYNDYKKKVKYRLLPFIW